MTLGIYEWGERYMPDYDPIEAEIYYGPDPSLVATSYGFRGSFSVPPIYDDIVVDDEGDIFGTIDRIYKQLYVEFAVPDDGKQFRYSLTVIAIPEPAEWMLLLSGFAALGAMLRRKASSFYL